MEHLVVTVLGSDKAGIANEVFKLVANCKCNLVDGRVSTMGAEFTSTLLLSGTWNALAKLEAGLPAFEKKYDVKTLTRRTQARTPQPEKYPYSSYIVAPDQPSVIHKITQFLIDQKINIHDLYFTSYKAPITEAPLLGISLSFSLVADQLIADFREQFIVFCDDNNFDAALEPQKS